MLLDVAYLLILLAVSPLLVWSAIRYGKYRAGWKEKFLGLLPRRDSGRPCAWFHAVSVGEVNLLKPLVARFAERHGDWECAITTTTKSGYELAKQLFPDRLVCYAPLDFSWAVRNAVQRIRPNLLVLAELELWPNWIKAARRAGARVAVVNARLSQNSHRGYRWIRSLVARTLNRLDCIAAQNEEYALRFRDLGAAAERVHVTGSIKFDNAQTNRANQRTVALAKAAGFAAGDIVFLAGSTQEPEEQLALQTFRELSPRFPSLRLVLVPRHPERFESVAQLLDRSKIPWQRRTALGNTPADENARVLLVDTVGELGAWWGTAAIAFVGGSMGTRGGQNMLEPAGYGAAVSFGPLTRNFRDIVEMLLAASAATVVSDQQQLTDFVRGCLEFPELAQAQGQRAQALVLSNQGALGRTLDLVDLLIADAAASAREGATGISSAAPRAAGKKSAA